MIKNRMSGFTVIELLISVTVISIIASIMVPMLLRSKMTANEASAICSVKAISEAQEVFRRTDWSGDGVLCYAYDLQHLYYGWDYNMTKDENGPCAENISRNLYRAWTSAPSFTPDHGYTYNNADGYMANDVFVSRYYCVGSNRIVTRYGVGAAPSSYMLTGANMFAHTDSGVIFQVDASLSSDYRFLDNYGYWGGILYDLNGMELNHWTGVQ